MSLESINKLSLQAYLHNEAAVELYKHLGFAIVSYNMEYKK